MTTQPPSLPARRLHKAWIILIGCILFQGGTTGILNNCLGVFYTAICTDLGFRTGDLSMYATIRSIVMALTMPLKIHDLVNTVEMLLAQADRRYKKEKKKKPPARNERDENYIRNAKFLLMDRNHLTEEAAYRYIQKRSMDNGTNMVETAQMILMLIWDETD